MMRWSWRYYEINTTTPRRTHTQTDKKQHRQTLQYQAFVQSTFFLGKWRSLPRNFALISSSPSPTGGYVVEGIEDVGICWPCCRIGRSSSILAGGWRRLSHGRGRSNEISASARVPGLGLWESMPMLVPMSGDVCWRAIVDRLILLVWRSSTSTGIPNGLSATVSRPSSKAAREMAADETALQIAFPASASFKGKNL